jgi:hypothetical protein
MAAKFAPNIMTISLKPSAVLYKKARAQSNASPGLPILIRLARGLAALCISLVVAPSSASAQNWIPHGVTNDTTTFFDSIASSADGTKLVIGSGVATSSSGQTGFGHIFTSTNSGGHMAAHIGSDPER